MQAELFFCRQCNKQYDNSHYLPRFLPCGHTFCSQCLTHVSQDQLQLKCPLDGKIHILENKSIEQFPVNVMLMQAIGEKPLEKKPIDFCERHQEEMRSVCLNDQCKVCIYCVQSGEHRDHVVKHIKDIVAEGDVVRKNMELMVEQFDKNYVATVNLLQEERKATIQGIKKSFDGLRALLEAKEKETISEMNFLFDLHTNKTTNGLEEGMKVREEIIGMISKLKDGNIDEKFFKICRGEIPSLEETSLLDLTQRRTEEMKARVLQCVRYYADVLSPQIQEFSYGEYLKRFLTKTADSCFEKEDGFNMYKIRSFLKFKVEGNSLMISAPKSGTPEDVLDSVPNLEQWRNIQQINAEFNRNEFTKDIISALDCTWKYFEKISSLKISFTDKKVSDADILKLFRNSPWAPELKEFELNLQNCPVSDNSLLPLMTNVIPKMTRVTSVTINISGTKLTNKTVEAFASSIYPMLPNLEKYQLGLNDTEINDYGAIKLFHPIENVRVFSMKIGHTGITDETLQRFKANMLPSLKKAEIFQFDVHNTSITSVGVSCLFANYSAVKTFVLDISSTGVTDECIEGLGEEAISTMKNLENFNLNLSETEVSDQGVAHLFMNMSAVKKITLALGTTNISLQTLEIFNTCVNNNIWELEKFHLDLENLSVSEYEICQLFAGLCEKIIFTINLTTTVANEINIKELMSGALLSQSKKAIGTQKTNLLSQMKKKLFSNNKFH